MVRVLCKAWRCAGPNRSELPGLHEARLEIEDIRWLIVRGAAPGGVTLLHDGQDIDAFPEVDRSRTVIAVTHIIRILKEKGYNFATVPELMDLDAAQPHP